MRFKDVFSIIGPAMVGPSSSHTAGAVRLGRVARKLLGELPVSAEITLYGSFADTYRGHGTDLAIAAGILDWDTDDIRIPESLRLAEDAGILIRFQTAKGPASHPNTAEIKLAASGRETTVRGASIGGGSIEIEQVDSFDVRFSAMYPTLLVYHSDRPGMIAEITGLLGSREMNIGSMDVDRKSRSGAALTAIESDSGFPAELLGRIALLPDVSDVRVVDLTDSGDVSTDRVTAETDSVIDTAAGITGTTNCVADVTARVVGTTNRIIDPTDRVIDSTTHTVETTEGTP